MPLEENPFIVHHLKALVRGQKFWGGQKCGSTISLWNSLMEISILLHKMAFQPIWKLATVPTISNNLEQEKQGTLGLCRPEIPYEDYILDFLIFCSSYTYKRMERKKIDFYQWPLKGRADMHQKIQPDGLTGRCRLAGNSEGHQENSTFSSCRLF